MSEHLATPAIHPANAKFIDGFWLYLLFALLATAGFFYINIMPAIVDGLITGLGFSNVQAGMVGSANIYGASVGSLCAVFVVRRIEWRPTLVVLFSLLIAIDLVSTVIHDPTVLIAVRAVHGFIGGMSVGIAYSVMARLHSPDRAFGVLLVLQFGLGGLGVMYLPLLVPVYGARILFFVLAALTAIALVSMLAIPKRLGKNRSKADLAAIPTNYRKLTVALSLAALFLFQGGNMALAAFIIRLGEHAHLAREFIGQALGWATWIGAAGAGMVIFMGTRFGRLRPLIAAFLLTFAGTAGFFWSESEPIFMIANVGTAITWSFVVPYLFGMISRLDPSGRLAALGGFVSKCGLASGPLVAGLLLRADNFDLLIWAALIALALSSVAAFAAARQVDQLESST
ncbi:MAG: MFS transporter [Dokdonella sp.]